jgi:hypothetical protein
MDHFEQLGSKVIFLSVGYRIVCGDFLKSREFARRFIFIMLCILNSYLRIKVVFFPLIKNNVDKIK